jgi:hypothetical protein
MRMRYRVEHYLLERWRYGSSMTMHKAIQLLPGGAKEGPAAEQARRLAELAAAMDTPHTFHEGQFVRWIKPSQYEAVIHAIAERIQGCPLPTTRVGNMPGTGLISPQRLGIGRFRTTESVGSKILPERPCRTPK